MYNPFSSARRSDVCGVLFHPGPGGFLQREWPTATCRRPGCQTTSPSSARSIGEPHLRPVWCAAWGRPSTAAGGGQGGRSTAFRGSADASRGGDADGAAGRPWRRPWRVVASIHARLGCGVARAAASDGRSALAAAQAVAARASGARWTLRELEMSVAAGITLECSCGGRWCRSARSLSCPVFRQPCCRSTGRHQSRPPSSSTSIFGAFDVPRTAHADGAADRPQRRPWSAMASIRALQLRQPS